MKKILTFGVFDYFHIGHLKLFQQCKQHGDYLIVGIQRDEFVGQFKSGEETFYTTEERMEMIRALRVVDEVFAYDTLGPDVMEQTEFDILALGEDHIGARFDAIEKWCAAHGKDVVRLQRTAGISSSSIKEMLKKEKMSRTIMVISAALDGRLIKAVEAANDLGYKTVACVRREDDVSIVAADRCYAVDGEETEELLEIARKEHIDGVVGLWDKSVLSAAVIARELGLPGNSPECVNCLLGKGSFRQLQKEAGVFCPGFVVTDTRDGLEEKCADLLFPIIVKPDQCSSSFGQTVLYDRSELIPAFEKAAAYSANGVVCLEEFVEQEDPLRVLEADVFLLGEDILWDGIHWNDRFPEAPLRPITDTFPADLDSRQEEAFRSAIRTMLAASGAEIGEFNVEGFFTKDGRYFIIEMNPRPAGYYSQEDILLFCGVDLYKLLVSTAVGDLSYYEELKTFQRQRNNIFMYPVFSFRSGVFDHVHYEPSMKDALLTFRPFPGGEPGAYVEDIHADNRPVGVAVFGFPTKEELEQARQNIRELVYVVLKDDAE